MYKLMTFILLSLSTLARGVGIRDLRPGDVLLQPLDCWTCSLIEAEEETIYSHIGVVLRVTPEVLVAESFGKVKSLGFEEFNSKTEQGQKLRILRFRNEQIVEDIEAAAQDFVLTFNNEFQGNAYDHDFRWNNFDQNGKEKFYCSELVSKLFQRFLGIETPIKKMHFQKNREKWESYFKGNIPDNQWGNSPGDYEQSELFYHVGDL